MSDAVDAAAFHAAFAQGPRFAREVRAQVEIAAPVDRVWAVLTDLPRYPEWNPFTVRVELPGSEGLQVGAPVDLHVVMPGRPFRIQREWVNRLEPQRRICWGLHMVNPGMLTTNRHQLLEPLGPERTRYTTWDAFSGWLVPLVFALYGAPMRKSFPAMADALRARCEAIP